MCLFSKCFFEFSRFYVFSLRSEEIFGSVKPAGQSTCFQPLEIGWEAPKPTLGPPLLGDALER